MHRSLARGTATKMGVGKRRPGGTGEDGWAAKSALAAAVAVLAYFGPLHLDNPVLHAAAETLITLGSLTGVGLLLLRWPRSRKLPDLLLLGALSTASLTQIAFWVLPALIGESTGSIPTWSPNWVRGGAEIRLMAFVLALVGALRLHASARDGAAKAAVIAERQRIARDLHDGLAQDLAFIAAHGDRLASEFGTQHPVAIAARRALGIARGTIVDLTASTAPTTGAALGKVARELESRYAVEVDVKVASTDAANAGPDLLASEREVIVRIAREAIVNAVQHGGAQQVSVELGSPDRALLLRVRDDGCGIDTLPSSSGEFGFGLPTMRAWAASLGGRLVTRSSAGEGTEVSVRLGGEADR
jgi:signal transduction histidine kinase